jgi:hypothetical protein
LGLRIQQYGWSVDRIHATFFIVVAGIWGLGYAGSVFLRQWPSAIWRINTTATLILAVIVVAMNSPVLDPYRLSANNQVERLLEGSTSPENFDFLYLRFNLGRYGNYALSRLKNAGNFDALDGRGMSEYLDPAISIDPKEHWTSVQNGLVPERRRREILAGAKVYPEGRVLPLSLVNDLASRWGESSFFPLRHVRRSSDLVFSFKKIVNETEGEELLLITRETSMVFDVSSGEPRAVGVFSVETDLSLLESEDVKVLEPRFKDIELGGWRYQVMPLAPSPAL